MGITDLNKKYNIEDMIKGDMFCATTITNGELADGVKDMGDFETTTIALHKDKK